jgi:hypothetical protein
MSAPKTDVLDYVKRLEAAQNDLAEKLEASNTASREKNRAESIVCRLEADLAKFIINNYPRVAREIASAMPRPVPLERDA